MAEPFFRSIILWEIQESVLSLIKCARWLWPFLECIDLLRRRALFEDKRKYTKFKGYVNGIYLNQIILCIVYLNKSYFKVQGRSDG